MLWIVLGTFFGIGIGIFLYVNTRVELITGGVLSGKLIKEKDLVPKVSRLSRAVP